ncbi:alpha/beta hydrolase [Nocardia sp. NPDC050712]|uniref:alpha/beta fold hydrolase n=1 Tax=Nocardia sp. NPDC050712 TaxID=3155518 RepID=UPI0033F49766
MSDQLTTARGDRVAYDLRGSGPALLFLAGAGPYRAIDPVTTATAELVARQGLTAIVYDRLGRGESQVDGRIDLARELEAVAALIDRAGGSAVLCGHSSGCSIALAAAVRGLAVDGLALWEAPLGPPDSGAREWAAEVERRIDTGDLEGAMRYYMKDMPPEFFDAWRQSPEFPDLVAQAGSLRPDGESLVWAESAPLAELLKGIEVPVLAMFGEQTFPEMPVAAASIVAAVAGAKQKQMPGAQHSWEPESMAKELVEFVFATR